MNSICSIHETSHKSCSILSLWHNKRNPFWNVPSSLINLSNIWVFSTDLFNIEFAENVDGNEEVCQRRGANLLLNGGHRWQRLLLPSKLLSDQSSAWVVSCTYQVPPGTYKYLKVFGVLGRNFGLNSRHFLVRNQSRVDRSKVVSEPVD